MVQRECRERDLLSIIQAPGHVIPEFMKTLSILQQDCPARINHKELRSEIAVAAGVSEDSVSLSFAEAGTIKTTRFVPGQGLQTTEAERPALGIVTLPDEAKSFSLVDVLKAHNPEMTSEEE